jgi:two-component system, LytTR family, sensor kinase
MQAARHDHGLNGQGARAIRHARFGLGLWNVAWWTAFGAMSALQTRQMAAAAGRPISWSEALVPAMASAWLWVPVTWAALLVARRAPLGASPWWRSVPAHAAATLGVIVFRAMGVLLLNDVVGWYRTLPAFWDVLVTSALNNVFFYWLLTAGAHAVYYAENARLREKQLTEARLNALSAQLQPHFLFNALNTIATLVHENPAAAERVVLKLSGLMRQTLDLSPQELVPLRDELRLLAGYLDVEQARFEERLVVRWDVAPEAEDALVPHLLLQPIVENAIVHGLRPLPGPVTIGISARREDGRLTMAVGDTGAGFDAAMVRERLGLGNTRARLDAVYRGDFTLDIESGRGEGTTVRLTLPFRAGARARPVDVRIP